MATSGEFFSAELSRILVHRDGRIRRKIEDAHVRELADSIRRLGLIHPIVIDRGYALIAGENRLEACRFLGWSHIPAQWSDALTEHDRVAIELEENVKRKDLDWKDRCDALLRFHTLQAETTPDWSLANTAEAIGYSVATVSQQLAVARELASGDEKVARAPKFSVAQNIVARKTERRKADELSSIAVLFEDETLEPARPATASPISVADFTTWASAYTGPPFNFLHCDFPYGIGADKFDQGAGLTLGGYDDSFENYIRLIDTLEAHRAKLLGTSAHLIFWCSVNHLEWTRDRLQSIGFWLDEAPLIWHKSDNRGALPRPDKGPRRIYETAWFGSWGDRKIISPVSNCFSGPTTREVGHMSEKSVDMLAHFFRMTCDGSTRLLDPTCGSGSALRAARRLGVTNFVGLEVNPDYARAAQKALADASA